MDQNNIHAVVMRRVRTIHTIKPLLSSTIFSMALVVVALWSIGREVWVARVLQNMPSITNIGAVFNFYMSAFLDTRLPVQVLTVVTLTALVWFTYSVIRVLHSALSNPQLVLLGSA